jgi:hypothetical protein
MTTRPRRGCAGAELYEKRLRNLWWCASRHSSLPSGYCRGICGAERLDVVANAALYLCLVLISLCRLNRLVAMDARSNLIWVLDPPGSAGPPKKESGHGNQT